MINLIRGLGRALGSPTRLLTVAILAGALVFGSYQVQDLRRNDERDQARKVVLELAENQVLDLTTLDATNVSKRIASMQERSEGGFKKQLSALAATFTSVIKKGGVKSSGAINATAVVSLTSSKAEVMVASTAQVVDGKSQSEARTYRFAVDLTKKNGRWLIANMEFVS